METELKRIMGLSGIEKGRAIVKLGRRVLKQLQTTNSPGEIAFAEELTGAMLNCRYELGYNKATEIVGADVENEIYEIEKALKDAVQKFKGQ